VTRPRYGVSPWFDEFPKSRRPDFPRLRDNASLPVVIVGGGLAGVFSAYAFAAAGVKVALLEAERIGHVGASRGPGVLQGEAAASYRDIEMRHGRKATRAMFEASRRAVLDLATTARRLGVRAVDTHDALRLLTAHTANEKALMRETLVRRDAGLDVRWLKPAVASRESRLDGTHGGMRLHDWGRVQPYQLLVAFAKAAVARGALIFERTPVRRVHVRAKAVDVHAQGRVLQAQVVVICTGEPTDLFRPLKRHLRLHERFVVMTEPLPAVVRKQVHGSARVLTDTDTPPHLVRFGDDGRVLVAGADQPRSGARAKDKVLVQRTGQLMYELSRMFPAISGVMPTYGWDMPIAITADEVMYAGRHRNYPRHLFAWGTRHDPAQAFLASRVLLREYFGKPEKSDAYFAFTRG
jgi:glycine/D-amino acid oxidase-like deaminating enzyme